MDENNISTPELQSSTSEVTSDTPTINPAPDSEVKHDLDNFQSCMKCGADEGVKGGLSIFRGQKICLRCKEELVKDIV